MKTFHFPLEKALQWRRAQLEVERTQAQAIAGRISQIDERRNGLMAERAAAASDIARSTNLESRELAAIAAFQLRVRRHDLEMRDRRLGFERELTLQRDKLMEAQRKVRLLEKLRGKRLAQWSVDLAREQEQLAAEAFLGRRQAAGLEAERADFDTAN